MEVWKREDPRVNFEKRFARYEIYTWTLCNSYLHEKQTSRIHPYYVRHKAETHENRRFFSIGMEFAENADAYVLKALSRS